jgi:AraC-like DNA-binding protein
MAVRLLHEIIEKKRPPHGQTILLPVTLLVRRSSVRNEKKVSTKTMDDFKSRAEGLLFQHHTESRPSVLIAKALGLSVSFFLVKYQKTFGKKFTRALHDLRIDRSELDLLTTGKSVTEIYLEHGFETHQSFNRAFFRRHQITPLQFRKKNR